MIKSSENPLLHLFLVMNPTIGVYTKRVLCLHMADMIWPFGMPEDLGGIIFVPGTSLKVCVQV